MPSSETAHIPKAVLYYSPKIVWSVVVLLALEEKGYGSDELDLKVVDLANGENYDPAYLRLNPKGTVPTLVVPLRNTLSEDVESRYKAITDSKAIVEFLDMSRSTQSRTHTTSAAPAPSLTPATIAFMTTSNEIINLLHSKAADPDNLLYLNAWDHESLHRISSEVLPVLQGKGKALSGYLDAAQTNQIHVSEKTKAFWREKHDSVEALLSVFALADKQESELSGEDKTKRGAYFETVQEAWRVDLKNVLDKLNKTVIGPYALGDQISIADLHLMAWLARVGSLAGVTSQVTEDGSSSRMMERISERTGCEGLKKLSEYWDNVKGRKSLVAVLT